MQGLGLLLLLCLLSRILSFDHRRSIHLADAFLTYFRDNLSSTLFWGATREGKCRRKLLWHVELSSVPLDVLGVESRMLLF